MKVLFNRNVIFITSAVTGLVIGSPLGVISFFNTPILMLIMALSFAETDLFELKNFKRALNPFLAGIGLNYFLTFFLFIALGRLFGLEDKIWAGLVIAAATPPGLAIIPFALVVKGDLVYASLATFSGFLATLILTPWLAAVFVGDGIIKFLDIFQLLFILILIPLIIGRIVKVMGGGGLAKKIHGPVVNLGFGIIFSVMLGTSREILIAHPMSSFKLLFISVLVVFGLAFFMKYFLRKRDIRADTKKSIILVATIKNSIFGAALGLTLLGPEAALAGTVLTFVILTYLIFVEKIVE